MSNNTPIPSLTQDESQLEKMAEKYPWCSVVHLSLLQQYKKNNSQQFDKQLHKTGLFFNNHTWLKRQLYLVSQKEETGKNDIVLNDKVDTELSENNQQSIPEPSSQQDSTGELSFEPLYTRDYFASQGIKVTDDPVSNDKLGDQMKSFTEWLKSMKKIHKEKIAEGDAITDKNIQQIAEHSNMDAEVVTEAMAEILIKQHKIEKAIALYKKISLINPSKSAYFADKINSLSSIDR
jgi:hypothetical protein